MTASDILCRLEVYLEFGVPSVSLFVTKPMHLIKELLRYIQAKGPPEK